MTAPTRLLVPLVVALACAATTASAQAAVIGRVTDGHELVAGPVFAGAGAVWVEADAGGTLFLGRSGAAAVRRIVGPPPPGLRHEVLDLAASARRVALVRTVVRPPPPAPPCEILCPGAPAPPPTPIADEVWAGSVGGPLRPVVRRRARAQCAGALAPRAVEASGATVVVAEAFNHEVFCRRRGPTGRVIALSPGRPPRALTTLRRERTPTRLAAEGAWVAWQTGEDLRGAVVVHDLRRRRVAYRVRARRFAANGLDVDAAGRLALVGTPRFAPCSANEPRDVSALAIASPRRPAPRAVPGRSVPDYVALSRGRIVAMRLAPKCTEYAGLAARRVAGGFGPLRPFGLPCDWRFHDFYRPEFDGSRLLYSAPDAQCSDPRRVIATAGLL